MRHVTLSRARLLKLSLRFVGRLLVAHHLVHTGPKETRATRAETIAYGDYVALNDEAGVRDAGKLRLEGKDYVVADGNVMHFRFAN